LDTLASALPPRVLLLENHPLLRECLPALLKEQIPGIAMERCSSVYEAIQQLPFFTYNLVISNVRLAELGNFFLLREHRMLHSRTPFIVTAGVRDHELARRARGNGAFDIITAPLVPDDAVSTVKVAHKMCELRMTRDLLRKELGVLRDGLRKDTPLPPATSLWKTTTAEEKYVSREARLRAYERTIEALERSLGLLRIRVAEHEYPVEQAVERRLTMLANSARIP
jgi:DNA-binding NarL/FixJ family response regulator